MSPTAIADYDELVRVLRAGVEELGIVFSALDAVAGLTASHTSHLLSEGRRKVLGRMSLCGSGRAWFANAACSRR
jgi:hypothetical protein